MNTTPKTVMRVDDLDSMVIYLQAWVEQESRRLDFGLEDELDKESKRAFAEGLSRPVVFADAEAGMIQAEIGLWHGYGGRKETVVLHFKPPASVSRLEELAEDGYFSRDVFLDRLREMLPGTAYEAVERWADTVQPTAIVRDDEPELDLGEVEPLVIDFKTGGLDGVNNFDVTLTARAAIRSSADVVHFWAKVVVNGIHNDIDVFRAAVNAAGWPDSVCVIFGAAPDPAILLEWKPESGLTMRDMRVETTPRLTDRLIGTAADNLLKGSLVSLSSKRLST